MEISSIILPAALPSPAPDQTIQGKTPRAAQTVYTPTWDPGAVCQNPERKREEEKRKPAALEGLPSNSPLEEN